MAGSEFSKPIIMVENEVLETDDEGCHQVHLWCAVCVTETFTTRIKKLVRKKFRMAGFLLTISAPTKEGAWQKMIPFFERSDVQVVDGGLKRTGDIPEAIRLRVRKAVIYYGEVYPPNALGRPSRDK